MGRNYFVIFLGMVPFGVLSYLTVGCLLQVRRESLRKVVLFVVCMFLSPMRILLSDWFNILCMLGIFLLGVWFCCEGSGLKKVTVGLMISSTVFAFSALTDNFLGGYVQHVEVLKLLFLLLLFLGTRYFAPREEYELTPTMWRLLLLLTATPIGIVLSVVLFSEHRQSQNTLPFMLLLGLSVLSFAGLLWTVTVLAKQRRLELFQTMTEMNEKYYQAMEQQNFEIRRLKHDLANHLQALAGLPSTQKDEYIKGLLDNPILTQTFRYCGDDTVNVIITNKAGMMAQCGTELHVKADIREPLAMEKPDICAVFGNALDNAAEAVKELPKDKRHVYLEARVGKGMLAVKVSNPCPENLAVTEKIPATTKRDKKAHGFGLKSIQDTMEKYGGKMEIRTENGNFVLFLYCPPQ